MGIAARGLAKDCITIKARDGEKRMNNPPYSLKRGHKLPLEKSKQPQQV